MTPVIHIIDDDEAVRESLQWLFTSRFEEEVAVWPSAEAFLTGRPAVVVGCIVLDVAMTGMSGLELLERHGVASLTVPVIVLTAHGDVPSAVRAIRAGARMMLEKPVSPDIICEHVRDALAADAADGPLRRRATQLTQGVRAITPREREVLSGYLSGLVTKEIAVTLKISVRTVEVHKAHILARLQLDSMAELVRQLTLHRVAVPEAS